MVCATCGSENKSSRRFCRGCGRPLPIACPRCETANDPADRFCGQCGTALITEAGEAAANEEPELDHEPHERRFVAVLFADLVGFTRFSESLDHEVVRSTLTTFYDRSRDIIERFGGSVQKFIGDAVMAVWGATVIHEDDAERAVRAGIELTDMVARLGDELDLGALSLRVGVLTGEASVGPSTPELGLVVGDLVNTASRLQTVAEPGTVVVGKATHQMLRDVVDFESRGSHDLKGKSASLEVWRAVRVRTDRTRQAPPGWEPPFVGRQEEFRLLKDALHATGRVGSSRLISVVGEAGIGKTRLVRELRKYVSGLADDVYWHEGRSPAYDQVPTFWALSEMVRQRVGIRETDDPLRSRTKLRTAVIEYVADAADQVWIEPRLAALLGLAPDETGEPGDFFAAVRRFFQSIAERGTTLLIFEDFHWADTGLIDFVREMVERSPRHPILVLTLARPDLLDRVPGWGAGRRNFASAHLGPLTESEMTELLSGMVEDLSPAVASSINEYANGIPLYAVELVRMLIADGALTMGASSCVSTTDLSAIRVPDTVRAVIGARLDRLPTGTRSLLQDAAVLGTAFTSDGLAAMLGMSVVRVEEQLEPLVHREVLEFDSDQNSAAHGRYRFVQSMIREVAYSRLTREERRIRHLRAAEYLDGLGEVELAGAVASHYMDAHNVTDDAASAEPLAAEASAALSDAADRAAQLHSHEQALAMVEHALELSSDPEAQASLRQRAARSAGALAQHEVAIQHACRSLEWYRANGDEDEVADAARQVANVLSHAYRAPEAIRVLEPVVETYSSLESAASVAAAAELARAYLMALRDDDAAAMSNRVVAPAERLGLTDTIVDTLITRGTALGNLGRLHEAVSLLHGASRYAEEEDLPLSEMRAANNLGHLLEYDDHVAALEACRRGLEMANRLGDVRFIGSFTWAVAAYLDRDGRFAEAQEMRDEVRERVELPPDSRLWYEMTDFMVAAVRGEGAAIELARDAIERSSDTENPQSAISLPIERSVLHFLAGEFDLAYHQALSIDEDDRLPGHIEIALFAAAMLGDEPRLESIRSQLGECRVRGRMVPSLAEAAAGAVAAVRGSNEDAVAGFARALGFNYMKLDRAKLQALFAVCVGRDIPEARIASDAAYEVFAESGAHAYIDVFAAGMPPVGERMAAGG